MTKQLSVLIIKKCIINTMLLQQFCVANVDNCAINLLLLRKCLFKFVQRNERDRNCKIRNFAVMVASYDRKTRK